MKTLKVYTLRMERKYMKSKLTILGILILLLTGCSEDKIGNDERPDWKAVNVNVTPQAMYLTIDNGGLPVKPGPNDLLGAFVDNECRSVESPYDEDDGKMRFYIKVQSTVSDENRTNVKVELRYYSESRRRIFVSQPIDFQCDGFLGSLEEGFVPVWK